MAKKITILAALAVIGLVSVQVQAAGTWTGASATTTNWGDVANWDAGTVPNATTTPVMFSNAGALNYVSIGYGGPGGGGSVASGYDVTTGYTVGDLTFNVDNDFKISSGQGNSYLTASILVGGNITVNALNPHTYTMSGATVFTGTSHTILVNSGTLQFTAGGYAAGSGAFSMANSDLTITGNGAVDFRTGFGQQFRKIYPNSITLSATTVFSAGGFMLSPDIVSGWERIIFNGGELDPWYGQAGDVTWDNKPIAGTLNVRKTNTGVMTLTGTNYIRTTGSFYLDAGTLRIVNSGTADNRFGDATQLSVGLPISSRLELAGSDSADIYEKIGNLDTSQGSGVITVFADHGVGHTTTLELASMSGSAAVVKFMGTDLGGSDTTAGYSRIKVTNATVSGKVYTTAGQLIDYLQYDNTLGIIPLPDTGRPTQLTSAATGSQFILDGQQDLILNNTISIKNMKLRWGGDVDLNGRMLKITDGDIIKPSGTLTRFVNGSVYFSGNTAKIENSTDVEFASELRFAAAGYTMYGAINKSGPGKLTIRGTSCIGYAVISTGTTVVSAGAPSVRIGWSEGDLEIAAPLQAQTYKNPNNNLYYTGNNYYEITSGLSTAGRLTKSGSCILIVGVADNPADFLYAGGTEVNDGVLQFGQSGGSWNSVPLHLGTGTVRVNSGGILRINRELKGTAPIEMNGGTLELSGIYANKPPAVVAVGAGLVPGLPLVFDDGTTSIVKFAQNGLLGAGPGMVFDISGAGTMVASGTGPSTDTSHVLFYAQTGASDSFTGRIVVDTILETNDASSWPRYVSLTTLQPGSYLMFGASTAISSQTFTGGGAIRMYGNLTGNAANTLTANKLTFAPSGGTGGGAGILTFQGNLTLSKTAGMVSTLAMDILHGTGTVTGLQPVAGVDYDQFQLQRILTSGGTLVTTGSANNPLAGMNLSVNITPNMNFMANVLTLVLTGSTNLTGAHFNGITFNNTGFADVNVGGTPTVGGQQGWVTLSNISYPGDANRDGMVTMTDYITWFNNFGTTFAAGLNDTNWRKGDFDGDGQVTMTDYIAWFNYFGDDQGGNTVPEPATLAMLALALPFVRRRRR